MSTIFRVEKTANYTVMSNTHLKDRRLSYKAKGLLSVILSLPPEWDYTITGLSIIAVDGVDSVKTALKELEKYGYVTRRQLRDERGRMAQNEYLVYDNPTDNPGFVPEETAEAAEETKPGCSAKKPQKTNFFVSPSAENPQAATSQTEKPETDTFIISNKNILNTNTSIHSISPAAQAEDRNKPREKHSKIIILFHLSENGKCTPELSAIISTITRLLNHILTSMTMFWNLFRL